VPVNTSATTYWYIANKLFSYAWPCQPARPWLYGIATRLVSRRRRDEVRFFRAVASLKS